MAEQRHEPFAPEKGPGDADSVSGESEENAADVLVLVSTFFINPRMLLLSMSIMRLKR